MRPSATDKVCACLCCSGSSQGSAFVQAGDHHLQTPTLAGLGPSTWPSQEQEQGLALRTEQVPLPVHLLRQIPMGLHTTHIMLSNTVVTHAQTHQGCVSTPGVVQGSHALPEFGPPALGAEALSVATGSCTRSCRALASFSLMAASDGSAGTDPAGRVQCPARCEKGFAVSSEGWILPIMGMLPNRWWSSLSTLCAMMAEPIRGGRVICGGSNDGRGPMVGRWWCW